MNNYVATALVFFFYDKDTHDDGVGYVKNLFISMNVFACSLIVLFMLKFKHRINFLSYLLNLLRVFVYLHVEIEE